MAASTLTRTSSRRRICYHRVGQRLKAPQGPRQRGVKWDRRFARSSATTGATMLPPHPSSRFVPVKHSARVLTPTRISSWRAVLPLAPSSRARFLAEWEGQRTRLRAMSLRPLPRGFLRTPMAKLDSLRRRLPRHVDDARSPSASRTLSTRDHLSPVLASLPGTGLRRVFDHAGRASACF